MALDPAGNFAYVTNLVDGDVSVYAIGANRSLTLRPWIPIPGGWGMPGATEGRSVPRQDLRSA
jgi:hypothetical protein